MEGFEKGGGKAASIHRLKVEWNALKENKHAYGSALQYFVERSKKFTEAAEWDASIYAAIIETMVSRRISQTGTGVFGFRDIDNVLNHMKAMNIPLGEAVSQLLIQAYVEEDVATMRLQKILEQRLSRTISQLNAERGKKGQRNLYVLEGLVEDLNKDVNFFKKSQFMERAVNLFDEGKGRGIKWDVSIYNSLILTFALRGRSEDVIKYLTMMREAGVEPNAETYSVLIRCFGESGDIEKAKLWFDSYRKSDLETEISPYAAALKAFVHCGKKEDAVFILSDIMPQDSVPLTNEIFGGFLEALILEGHFEDAIGWINLARDENTKQLPKPDSNINELLFAALVASRNFDQASAFFPTDAGTITPFLSEYGLLAIEKKHITAAFSAFTKICQRSGKSETLGAPDRMLALAIINAFSQQKNVDGIMELVKCLRETDFLFFAKERALSAALRAVRSDFLRVIEIFLSIEKNPVDPFTGPRYCGYDVLLSFEQYGRLKEDGSGPILTEDHFKTIFTVCFSSPQFNRPYQPSLGRQRVTTALEDFTKRGLTMSTELSDRVIARFRFVRDFQGMNFWMAEMRKLGVITGPLLDGEFLPPGELEEISKKIVELSNSGNVEAAQGIFEELAKIGKYPNRTALFSLIRSLGRAKNFNAMEQVADKVLSIRDKRSKNIDSKAIDQARAFGYVIGKKPMAAYEIVQKLGERSTFSETFYRDLLTATASSTDRELSANIRIEIVKTCLRQLHAGGNASIDPAIQAVCLRALIRAEMVSDAIDLFNQMIESGKVPSRGLCTDLVKLVCLREDIKGAMKILDDLVDFSENSPADNEELASVPQNVFIEVMAMLSRISQFKSAMHVYDMAIGAGVKPGPEILALAAKAMAETGNLRGSLDVLQRMQERRLPVNDQVVESILGTLSSSKASKESVYEFGAYILKQVQDYKDGIAEAEANVMFNVRGRNIQRPNVLVLEQLCQAYLKIGDVDAAMTLLSTILDLQDRPTTKLCNTLMAALIENGRTSDASRILERMPSHSLALSEPALAGYVRSVESFLPFLKKARESGRDISVYEATLRQDGFSNDDLKRLGSALLVTL
ncbi:hypothetical protein HDU97_007218 [Phlyctochytrium planicorne]|nr:hypothetical protein HDU97_007218 [Phlyctochytrium planicorne]